MSITPDQVMPSSAPPRNRKWRTISSCRPLPSLVASTSPHLLGNVVDGVQDALRVCDRQILAEVRLLDERVGRHLHALLIPSVIKCLPPSQCPFHFAGARRRAPGLTGSSNRHHLVVTARSARIRSSCRAPPGPARARLVNAGPSVSAGESGC